jgi:hypothetical protein
VSAPAAGRAAKRDAELKRHERRAVPHLPPVERHDPLADDKLILSPSQRRPRHRDLERLVARWKGWR